MPGLRNDDKNFENRWAGVRILSELPEMRTDNDHWTNRQYC